MGSERGLTLIELMVGLSIAAILAAIAAPSFRTLLARRAVESAAADFMADFRYARTEALKRGHPVSVCGSSDGLACTHSKDWRGGWIVFADRDANRLVDAGEAVLRVQGAARGLRELLVDRGATPSSFTFHPNGLANGVYASVSIKASGADPEISRCAKVSGRGRVVLLPEGTTPC
ncbi:GspH/FimT family pseudopilin [Ramlibacter aurantiacus]|nr:GspH/FimT family pseudopilin [Ramlibacter aurantiacus]